MQLKDPTAAHDVVIRQMAPKDNQVVKTLLMEHSFMPCVMNNFYRNVYTQSTAFSLVLISAIVFQQTYSFYTTLTVLLSICIAAYVLFRYVAIFVILKSLPDMKTGLYNYWINTGEGNRKLFVAEVDGAVVGAAAVRIELKHEAEVMRVVVNPTHRGKGIATKLMQKVFEFCQDNAVHSMFLHTGESQNEGIAMYKSLGFVCTQRDHVWIPLVFSMISYKYRLSMKPRRVSPSKIMC